MFLVSYMLSVVCVLRVVILHWGDFGNERVQILERSVSGSKYKSNSMHNITDMLLLSSEIISTCHSVCKIGSSNACKIGENLANDSRNLKLILLILIPFKGICDITVEIYMPTV